MQQPRRYAKIAARLENFRELQLNRHQKPRVYDLFCWKGLLIFGEIDRSPFAFDDSGANLRGGLAVAGLLVGIEIFRDADVATSAVLAGETIEQAAMALAAVAVAVAGLAIERLLDPGGNGVGVL